MEAEVVIAGLVFTTLVVLAFCADAALVAVAVKSVRRRSSSSTRS